jgi:nucleotide-binding universal stress UspA family protein
MKVLVLTSEPVDADSVRGALGDEAEGAEVLVVSPALNDSPVAFWVSDSDEAIQKAEQVAQETVERLEEAGVDAAGDTGESEPLQALQDALATFPADRIVVFAHPQDEEAYREEKLAEVQQRFGIPVVRGEISR